MRFLFATFSFLIVFQPLHAEALSLQKQAEGTIRLIDACQAGELDTVRECLDLGVGPDLPSGFPPLWHAAIYGRREVVRLLMERGASTSYFPGWLPTSSVLSIAIEGGDLETVRMLLDTGILKKGNKEKWVESGITGAIFANRADMLDLLVQYGVDPMMQTQDGYNTLTLAANRDAEKIIAYLLKHGVDPDTRDKKGRTALACAPLYGTEIVSLLLKAGANPNLNSGRHTFKQGLPYLQSNPLLQATLTHNLETVRLLLAAGADPAEPDNLPLLTADMRGNAAIAELLLAAGAPPIAPYASLDLIQNLKFKQVDHIPSTTGDISLVFKPAPQPLPESSPENAPPPSPVKAGILVRDRSLLDLEALLSAKMSTLPQMKMVERASLEAVSRELEMKDGLQNSLANLLRAGEMAGADLLVILNLEDPYIHLSLVNAETGLVLAENNYPRAEDPNKISRDFIARVTAHRWKQQIKQDQLLLVSIPSLISEQTDLFSLRTAAWIKRGLEQEITRHPQVYLLERSFLGNLEQEKALNDSQRAFFNSGWILDGSVSMNSEEQPELVLRLRAQRPGSDIKIELSQSVSLEDPSALLPEIVASLLTEIGNAPEHLPVREAEEEMNAFLENAKRAGKLNDWKTAHRNAAAAWALGDRRVPTKDYLVRSAVHAIRESDLAIMREVDALPESLRKLAAYRSPLVIPNEHPSILRRAELFEMSHRLLDVYDTVLRTTGELSDYDTGLLAFQPIAMRAIILPLVYSPTLSDQKRYGQELTAMRKRILGVFDATLALTASRELPKIYDATLAAKLEHLPWLIPSHQELHREAKQIFKEAETLIRDQHNPHLIYHTAHLQGIQQASKIKTWNEAQWFRMCDWMTGSGDPFAEIIGRDIRRHLTMNPGKQWQMHKDLFPLIKKAVQTDPTYISRVHHLGYSDLKIPVNLSKNWHKDWLLNYYGPSWVPKIYTPHFHMINDRSRFFPFFLEWSAPNPNAIDPFRSQNKIQRKSYHYRNRVKELSNLIAETQAERGARLISFSEFRVNQIEDLDTLDHFIRNIEIASTRLPTPPEVTASHARKIKSSLVQYLKAAQTQRDALTTQKSHLLNLTLKNFHFSPFKNDHMPLIPSLDGFSTYTQNELIFMNKKGEITLRFPTPKGFETASRDLYTDFEESMDATRIAVYLSQYYPNKRNHQRIGIYNLQQKQWRLYPIPELPDPLVIQEVNRLESLILLKDRVVYSYILNSSANPNTHGNQTALDPLNTIGISSIRLEDAAHSTLVQNRRTPSLSPLDDFDEGSYRPFQMGNNRIGLRNWIYSYDTESWSEGKTRRNRWWQKRDSRRYMEYDMMIDGAKCRLTGNSGALDSNINVSVTLPSTSEPDQPKQTHKGKGTFTFPDWKPIHFKSHPVEYQDSKGIYHPTFAVRTIEYGVVFYNKAGFCFVPKSEFVPLLKPIIQSLKEKRQSTAETRP